MSKMVKAGFVTLLAVSVAAGCGADPAGDANGTSSSVSDNKNGSSGGGSGGSSGSSGSGGSSSSSKPDYSSFVGFQSFHPAGTQKTYNTGFDGTNSYVVPLVFFADVQPKVTFGDADAAELSGPILTVNKELLPDIPGELDGKIQVIFVKTKKAGQTTITATAGKVTDNANLVINTYTVDDVKIGEERYNKGSPSCNGCHEKRSVHNPGLLADLSDETILGIAVEGKSIQRINPQTSKVETVQPNGGDHKWKVTDPERKGLMAYLRSRSFQFQLPSSGEKK